MAFPLTPSPGPATSRGRTVCPCRDSGFLCDPLCGFLGRTAPPHQTPEKRAECFGSAGQIGLLWWLRETGACQARVNFPAWQQGAYLGKDSIREPPPSDLHG
ncbi:hypothetical protein IT6_02750 [Methylacidiphilum caldifontis]|uniref:hypothetical protein n=1 Tax=Methylacidiphilum caldifontis TaxID=2795386 RepID=UPI001A8FAD58|nr:hypothetical protein [Methylacidiphilum caldifontis]QSR89221.1 hypothetical protein IT6_02750 [Methylacidiphilum caldifontis]